MADGGASAARARTLRVCALYPDLMNIYADRGNLLVLERRCSWRGIGFELIASGLGEALDPDAGDLFYIGVLGVCGGYQLLGHSYTLDHERIPGVGLLDVETVREGARLIGNVAIEVALNGHGDGARPAPRVLAGFENHGGRTRLGDGQQPLGRVLKGYGNDGASGVEGAISANTIGTYMHGPLLPKNAWFADWLIGAALDIEPQELAELDDELERGAHLSARRAAGV
jgi:CobQ-like glutamine amidotransferase family enzyme